MSCAAPYPHLTLTLLYYDNECMTTRIRSLSYAFMEMNMSVGPDVSGMTILRIMH
jgi:hypothetical protein